MLLLQHKTSNGFKRKKQDKRSVEKKKKKNEVNVTVTGTEGNVTRESNNVYAFSYTCPHCLTHHTGKVKSHTEQLHLQCMEPRDVYAVSDDQWAVVAAQRKNGVIPICNYVQQILGRRVKEGKKKKNKDNEEEEEVNGQHKLLNERETEEAYMKQCRELEEKAKERSMYL